MDDKTLEKLEKAGVVFLQKETVYLQGEVKIGAGTVVEPFCVILGETEIGCNCHVGSFSYLNNAKVADGAVIRSSRITDSSVGKNTVVGPCAHLRQNANVGEDCRIGNFVEVKNSTVDANTKASHLAYVGDATVGKNCNIGCGVIFVNYDGRKKHKTQIGDNVFVGCNCNLVAPLSIADGCFVACGTTLTKDTQQNDFVIGRARETVKPLVATKYIKGEK